VAEAERLANYIFRNNLVFTSDSITKLMNAGEEKTIRLVNPIPVFICYFTSWIDHNGVLNFRKDIYEHDAKLAKEIFGK
jgi:murein L,D-transpeptidase YcbB/YkuD